jgi:hypothetical protein
MVFQRSGAEQFQPVFSAGSNRHPMLEARETLINDFPEQLVVINAKDVQGAFVVGLWPGVLIGNMANPNATSVRLRLVRHESYVHVGKSGLIDT